MKIVMLGVLLAISNFSNAASFDCDIAKSKIEIAICSDSTLSQLDEQLAKIYGEVRANLTKTGKNKIKKSQSAWLDSLTSECSKELKGKAQFKLAHCLSGEYKRRIEYLSDLSKPIKGLYKYPVISDENKKFTYEMLDGSSPLATFINAKIKKVVSEEVADSDNEDTEIQLLGNKIILIKQHGNTWGGAHPDFYFNFHYEDADSLKDLTAKDFFLPAKMKKLSTIVNKEIRKGADQDTLDCYKSIDAKDILDRMDDFRQLRITPATLDIELPVPRYCRNLQGVSLDNNLIKPYMTDLYKSISK